VVRKRNRWKKGFATFNARDAIVLMEEQSFTWWYIEGVGRLIKTRAFQIEG